MIQSLIKAANILEFLKSERREFSIAEISKEIQMPPSTAHRILNTLIECGYVVKDELTHLYKLGPGLISLGIAASSYINLQQIAYQILRKLSDLTLEDSFLIIQSENKGMVIAKVEGKHSLKIVENFGLEIDLHCGAIRKAILANNSDEFIEEYIKNGLKDYLNSEVDPKTLRLELEQIRKEKVSTSDSEYIKDAIGIGDAVFNYKKELVGAIGIVAPKERVSEEVKKDFIEAVKSCADEFSYKLGYFK